MDTAVPTTAPSTTASPGTTANVPPQATGASPYVWTEAGAEERAAHGLPTQSMDGGPQVSQPAGDIAALPAKVETPRAATVRRVATGAVGLGLVAAAMLVSRGRRKAKAEEPADQI